MCARRRESRLTTGGSAAGQAAGVAVADSAGRIAGRVAGGVAAVVPGRGRMIEGLVVRWGGYIHFT